MKKSLLSLLSYILFLSAADLSKNENDKTFYCKTVEGETDTENKIPTKRCKVDEKRNEGLQTPPTPRVISIKRDPSLLPNKVNYQIDELPLSENDQVVISQMTPKSKEISSTVSVDDILKSIQHLTGILQQEAEALLHEMLPRDSKWYKQTFNRTNEVFDIFLDHYYKALYQDKIDYTSIDKEIIRVMYDETYYEGTDLPFLVFSEIKFNNFFSAKKSLQLIFAKMRRDLDYELMSVIEFINIQRYYHCFPELIILERIREVNVSHQNKFCYLRALNVFLVHFVKDKKDIPVHRDKISLFIENIIDSLIPGRKCSVELNCKQYVSMNACGKIHQDYFFIFSFYIVNSTRRSILERRIRGEYTETHGLLKHIKVITLSLIYKHLLLNLYFDVHKYEEKRILDFVGLIQEQHSCINCVMEKCKEILCA